MLGEMEEEMQDIKKNLKESQDREKIMEKSTCCLKIFRLGDMCNCALSP